MPSKESHDKQGDHFDQTTNSHDFLNEKRLYLPLSMEGDYTSPEALPQRDDLELLVLYRNFFAFLSGGPLVATARQVSLFSIFMGISRMLVRYKFDAADDSTYGAVASRSFAKYCRELRLADVRSSREKNIEALVLGEQMKSWTLFTEAFTHAAGKLEHIKTLGSPKYAIISSVTANRLERASHELEKRLHSVHVRLDEFDFPSMFAGIATSQTSVEAKQVRFKEWKVAFANFRKHVLTHYSSRYGAWPPKSNSKRNGFEQNGLNRILLQLVYQDFTDLYDMLVDRTVMPNRATDMHSLSDDPEFSDMNESIQHTLRKVESEYDRSTPPVLPPIPFDLPILPSFSSSFNREHAAISSNSARCSLRLKSNEVNELLLGSYNRHSMKGTHWLQDFITFERRSGQDKTLDEIVDLRCGQWLFIYAVLQILPMVLVDVRDIKFTEGVEYFLCMPPRGGRPWAKDATAQSRSWFNVPSGGGLVNLPTEMVDHGVEAIYQRSHCWMVAEEWASRWASGTPSSASSPLFMPAHAPVPTIPDGSSPHLGAAQLPLRSPYLRALSEDGSLTRLSNRSSVVLGLEEVEPPPEQTSRPTSSYNPHITFDTILGTPFASPAPPKKG